MDASNNDNHSVTSGNMSRVSSISAAPNTSNTSPSSSTIIIDSPRRSSRLSSRSPKIPSRTTTQSNIHRTMSGGVANNHSPKLNNRKQNSFTHGCGDYSNTDLPSDQSDDDEMICNNTAAQPKLKGLATRSKVLSYFEQQTDGFKCKSCNKIVYLFTFLPPMDPKQSYNNNATQEKENVNQKKLRTKQKFSKKNSNDSNTSGSSLLVGTPQEEEKTTNDENIHSFVQEADSDKKEMDKLIFSDISNKNDGLIGVSSENTNTVIYDLISSQNNVGQKRHIEESSDSILDENNIGELIRLKKKCLEIEKRVEVLETTWMPCPDHLDMVQNIFNGIIEDINHDRVVMNNNNKISDSNNGLNIDPEILSTLKKDSSTATARGILKYLYPHPPDNFKLSDIHPALVADIVRYSQESHPDDATTTVQMRRAMSNYFALITYRKKRKSIIANTSIKNQ